MRIKFLFKVPMVMMLHLTPGTQRICTKRYRRYLIDSSEDVPRTTLWRRRKLLRYSTELLAIHTRAGKQLITLFAPFTMIYLLTMDNST